MQRILKLILLCLITQSLFACRPPIRTSINNDTGQPIYTNIPATTDPTPLHGMIEAGNSFMLPEKIDELLYIDYSYGDHQCRMTHAQMVENAHPDPNGWLAVSVKPCAPTAR